MINSEEFTTCLIKHNLGLVIEVPCSYLKDILNYLNQTKRLEVINPVNEALVMGIASGYYLSTGKIPIVALQNSGFMNTLNALTSLNQLYQIPVFYLITWRGELGHDAPEHDITGLKMEEYLKTFDLPYEIVSESKYQNQISKLADIAIKTKKPVALVIRKGSFEAFPSLLKPEENYFSRYEAIKLIKESSGGALCISSTGFPSRDSFSVLDSPDFYMVGSMGHTFSIALGIAPNTKKKIVVLDGEGSSLMHLGGLASFNPDRIKNINYFILDNEGYESTGGQPTVSPNVNFKLLAKSFNFKNIYEVSKEAGLKEVLRKLKTAKESSFIHVKIVNSSQKVSEKRVSDKYTCPQIKERFMENFKRVKNH
ncbi:MAG: Phosphonopyruvate decarboxylase [uncultured bacterium]|uniref:Phosphonopyruvate decarboxylase n=1 Tax=Candidatus Daviesbacteria bacterium GW2011_GWC2_40_12 TaxID=1618431 RepID=A0A0G0QRC8_9BACT|nr:MAG: Phosphonopyruvate decarboxylase [uncultured bacterium]KKQ82995.1 MAG: Phosphonopyruvate decarboxylase [Candidatus Daviesbacteria bacterium GW2011_GWF2_38_7]KKR17289.1 MAG: Phosphonopyruvate decarboxylase [Candidatus Daviesbacteria bacterium GW2011_GWA2_39_33]KKR42688.1 MAG: Phosphonopyruvate decarboxylase [Candidatus Daviesbacteria bacterium GW2011_GWC2_40_12]OGE21361.1 MAG: hypothetical protein A2778_04305 [Candidatus Daviesbacteria bacterium RIFCSPHIGHO2_01_FULL_40_24]OGE30121.1 MAG: